MHIYEGRGVPGSPISILISALATSARRYYWFLVFWTSDRLMNHPIPISGSEKNSIKTRFVSLPGIGIKQHFWEKSPKIGSFGPDEPFLHLFVVEERLYGPLGRALTTNINKWSSGGYFVRPVGPSDKITIRFPLISIGFGVKNHPYRPQNPILISGKSIKNGLFYAWKPSKMTIFDPIFDGF